MDMLWLSDDNMVFYASYRYFVAAPTSFEDCEILMTTTDMDMSTDVPDLVAEELESQVLCLASCSGVPLWQQCPY